MDGDEKAQEKHRVYCGRAGVTARDFHGQRRGPFFRQLTPRRHHWSSGFSFYEGFNLPRDAPGTRDPTTKSGQREKPIPEVTGPDDIRRYNFLFPSFFGGKGFCFFTS